MPVPADQLIPFLVASVLVTLVPGADMALVTRQVLIGSRGLARRTIAGNLTGLVVHGLALAIGLSALIMASATAFTAVRLAGAAYLIVLGIQALMAARNGTAASGPGVQPRRASPRRAFVHGLMSTVLNPKPALFFLTFLPQFVDEGRPVLAQVAFLAGIHIAVGLLWLTLYAELVHRAQGLLTRADVRRRLQGATGVVLVALGLRVAVERR